MNAMISTIVRGAPRPSNLRYVNSFNRAASVTAVSASQSLSRLNEIFESYRISHYSQELPRRFRKDIVIAASKKSSPQVEQGVVSAEGIEHVLCNIGKGDMMSHDEIEMILREASQGSSQDGYNEHSSHCVVTVEKMMDLLTNRAL